MWYLDHVSVFCHPCWFYLSCLGGGEVGWVGWSRWGQGGEWVLGGMYELWVGVEIGFKMVDSVGVLWEWFN